MGAIEQFFRQRGVDVDEALVVDALDALLGDRIASPGSAPLPAADHELLRAHAGLDPVHPPEAASLAAATATTAAAATALVADALTVAEVAERAGVSPSRVRHWISDGAVHAVAIGGRNLLPAWQLGPDGRPLPHLGDVLGALPDHLHPLALAGFFAAPQPELELAGRTLSPAEWLLAGGVADPVVALAEGAAVLL